MEARSVKALALVDRGRVVRQGDGWLVFSLNSVDRYRVTLDPLFCSCPDHEEHHSDCKHIRAVRIVVSRQGTTGERKPESDETLLPPFPWPKKTYKQADWSRYEAAQVHEKDEFLVLLHDLCSRIEEPAKQRRGRPSLSLADQVFSICLKVYVGMSTGLGAKMPA